MKGFLIKFYSTVFLFIFLNTLNAQENKQSAFSVNYNYQFAFGNISKTFGNNSSVGLCYFFETTKNYLFGIEGNYMFGNTIKDESIFDGISSSDGGIIGGDGQYANINLMEIGFNTYLLAGYCFHNLEKNLSGVYLSQGIGYLQHKIFIDTKNQNIPQLNENMKKGYDRFSNGISAKFSIDYKFYHKKGMFQISSGLNYTIAHTKIQRNYDFANNLVYPNKRKWDNFLGIKFEVIIPIQRKNDEQFHYF
jgi:hypothetical protein